MEPALILDKTFKGKNYTQERLPKAEYDNCLFDTCNFSQADITNCTFNECEFLDCDLSNATFTESVLNIIKFSNCKILGVNFHTCNDFLLSFSFEKCTLDFSSFYKMKLKKTIFNTCKMQKVDFSEADLTEAIFKDCNLDNAHFQDTNLEKADFSTAFNFTINPEENRMQKAKFSKDNLEGLLTQYKIVIT